MVNEVMTVRLAQFERPAGVTRLEQAQQTERSGRANQTPNQAAEQGKPPDVVEVDRVVNELNELVQNTQRSLQFSVDQESGRTVIRVKDSETDEVIRQIPPEEALQLAQRFEESLGALVRTEA